jgi:hypothetical protein
MSAKAKGARNEHRSMRLLEAASFARPQSRGIPPATARGVANPQRGHWITLETAVAPTASGACDAKALHNEAHGEAKTRESGSPQG